MIRKAEKKDSSDIRIMMEQLEGHPFDPDEFYRFYLDSLNEDGYLMWVYEADERAVGIVTLILKRPIHHMEKTAEICELVVNEDYRNRKIGEELLNFAHGYAKDNGIAEIELNSKKIRVDAHRFYFRHGYEDLRNNLTIEFK